MSIFKKALLYFDSVHDFVKTTDEYLNDQVVADTMGYDIIDYDSIRIRSIKEKITTKQSLTDDDEKYYMSFLKRKEICRTEQERLSLYILSFLKEKMSKELSHTHETEPLLEIMNNLPSSNFEEALFDLYLSTMRLNRHNAPYVRFQSVDSIVNAQPPTGNYSILQVAIAKGTTAKNEFHAYLKKAYKTDLRFVVDACHYHKELWCLETLQTPTVYHGLHFFNDPGSTMPKGNAIACIQPEFQEYELTKEKDELLIFHRYGCKKNGEIYSIFHQAKRNSQMKYINAYDIFNSKPKGIPKLMNILYILYKHIIAHKGKAKTTQDLYHKSLIQYVQQNIFLSIANQYKIACSEMEDASNTDNVLLDKDSYVLALLDIKRSGDFLQAKAVQHANMHIQDYKYIFVSEDRLAILFALLLEIPCIRITMPTKNEPFIQLQCFHVVGSSQNTTHQLTQTMENLSTEDNINFGGMMKSIHAFSSNTLKHKYWLNEHVSFSVLLSKCKLKPFFVRSLLLELQRIKFPLTVFWYFVFTFVIYHVPTTTINVNKGGAVRSQFRPTLKSFKRPPPFRPRKYVGVKRVPATKLSPHTKIDMR